MVTPRRSGESRSRSSGRSNGTRNTNATSRSSLPRTPTSSPRTPSDQGIAPELEPPVVRSTNRIRSRPRLGNNVRSSSSSDSNRGNASSRNERRLLELVRANDSVDRLVRRLFMTDENLDQNEIERQSKRRRPNTAWRKRVRTVRIPNNVAPENKTALFTGSPVRRGIPCVRCKKYMAKSNFKGLVRKGRPCPYCRHPIRRANFESSLKNKSVTKRTRT